MIVLLSPAKTLNEDVNQSDAMTKPQFASHANKLVKTLKSYSAGDLKKLMSISDKLAEENANRYQSFKSRSPEKYGFPAVHLFAGDVYRGLGAEDFTKKDESYAQNHLRILSGLYGILKPLDSIQPYRLEMGTSLSTERGNNLYQFWGDDVTKELNKTLERQKDQLIVNLASNEYFKVINKKKLKGDVLDIGFKEFRDGKLKFISFSAKVARGLMARYIVKNQVSNKKDLKGFDYEGYSFSEDESVDQKWTFVR